MHVLFVHDLSCGFAFRVSETVGEKTCLARRDVLLREPTVSISRCREGTTRLITKPTWPVLGGDRAVFLSQARAVHCALGPVAP